MAGSLENGNPSAAKSPRFFYGYWIVAATFFFSSIYSGAGFYAFSLFAAPLQNDFGWGRGQIMLGLTIFFMSSAVGGLMVGRLVDRFESRKIIAIGGLITGIGFLMLSQLNGLWMFYASYVVTGIGMAAAGMVATTTLISNWFDKNRGTAVGVMSAGIGAGGIVFAPLIGVWLLPVFGWRTSYVVVAGICMLIIPIALLILRNRPSDMGLYPDGIVPNDSVDASHAPEDIAPEGFSFKEAVATPAFWLISISFLAHGFCEVGILQSVVPHLTDTGFTLASASYAFGMVGFFSLIGKLGFGWLCDRMSAKSACILGLGVELTGLLILLAVKPHIANGYLLWPFVAIIGLGVGSWLPTMSMMVSTNFGLAAYGAIFGFVSFTMSFGAATGPLTAGIIFDVFGNYQTAFYLFIVLYLVAIGTIFAVRDPKSKIVWGLIKTYGS